MCRLPETVPDHIKPVINNEIYVRWILDSQASAGISGAAPEPALKVGS